MKKYIVLTLILFVSLFLFHTDGNVNYEGGKEKEEGKTGNGKTAVNE